jgi:uncharacterized protein (TIGR00661 family)
MRCKVFLSDEGYGHIVRQRAVIEELHRIQPELKVLVQTKNHLDAAKRFIANASFEEEFNNIVWYKQANGSPDVSKIGIEYADYEQRAAQYIQREIEKQSPDFIISDFVYEAFEVGARKNIPTFGVAHFTWDWFFSKLYPPPLSTSLIHNFVRQAGLAKKLYFPPFTPEEIVTHFKNSVMRVPLILRSEINHKVSDHQGKFKVLIMDSGAGVIAESIKKALESVKHMDDMLFFISDKFKCDNTNVSYIPADDLMVDYVADMNLVIGRAGFNTISECIGLRTPMLLLGEAMNPEINENILMLKKDHLGSFISLHTFENELGKFLPDFLQHEYKFIERMMKEHSIETNGAEVVARDILNHL